MRTGSSEEGRNRDSTHRCQTPPAALSAHPPSAMPAHGWPRSGSPVGFSPQGTDTSLWLPTPTGLWQAQGGEGGPGPCLSGQLAWSLTSSLRISWHSE